MNMVWYRRVADIGKAENKSAFVCVNSNCGTICSF